MKRKVLITILSLAISVSIVACGKENTTKQIAETETVEESTEQETETQETIGIEKETQEEETQSSEENIGLETEPPYEIVDQGDYPDNRSDHQEAWDNYKETWDDFSVYGTTTKGKCANDFPYYGDTGYDPYGTILQERTTDKGYTVMYDTNTGKVYYSGMTLPTGSIWEEGSSGSVLFQYVLDNGLNSTYDITYSEMQELLGVYNGD